MCMYVCLSVCEYARFSLTQPGDNRMGRGRGRAEIRILNTSRICPAHSLARWHAATAREVHFLLTPFVLSPGYRNFRIGSSIHPRKPGYNKNPGLRHSSNFLFRPSAAAVAHVLFLPPFSSIDSHSPCKYIPVPLPSSLPLRCWEKMYSSRTILGGMLTRVYPVQKDISLSLSLFFLIERGKGERKTANQYQEHQEH